MYLRITRLRFDPAKADELLHVIQPATVTIRQLPGFQGAYDGLNRAGGTGVAVSMWDTSEHAQASSVAFVDIAAGMQALGVQLAHLATNWGTHSSHDGGKWRLRVECSSVSYGS